MSNVDIERNERELVRWRILRILHIGGPWPVNEGVIQASLEDGHFLISVTTLRKELDYLERKELIKVHKSDSAILAAQLTGNGTDVVEYSAACPTGIRRPAKWD